MMRRDRNYNPVLALILSIVPGVGHIYRGKPFKGILWFLGSSFAYMVNPPLGIVIHMICAANAAFADNIGEDALAR